MENKVDSKEILRAWLYQLLAELETAKGVEATKTETAGRCVEIRIQFKV